jgi:hypothetical protein
MEANLAILQSGFFFLCQLEIQNDHHHHSTYIYFGQHIVCLS